MAVTTVKSRAILTDWSNPSTKRTTVSAPQNGQVRGELTTGLFQVTTGVGNPITVAIFLSSFSAQPKTVRVQVKRVVDGRLQTILTRTLEVQPMGGTKITLMDLAGATAEVTVSRPSGSTLPSVVVTEFFPADAGIIVHLIKSPGDFVPV